MVVAKKKKIRVFKRTHNIYVTNVYTTLQLKSVAYMEVLSITR